MNINLHQQLRILINSSLNLRPVTTGLNCAEEGNPVSFIPSSYPNNSIHHGSVREKHTDLLRNKTEYKDMADVSMNSTTYEWLNMIISSMPKAMLVTDTRRNIIITNQQFCQLFHLHKQPHELIGYNTLDLLGDISGELEDIISVSGKISEIYDNRQPSDNDELRLRDGRIVVRDHRPLYFQNEFFGHMWTYADETERIKARQKLNEQRDFYEHILNFIPADIAVFSPEHRYRFVNPAGISDPAMRKWIIDKTDADYCVFRGKDMSIAETRRALFKKVVAEGKQHTWVEKSINRRKEEQSILRTLNPVYDQQGNLELVIGYAQNITEQKRIEEQVRLNEKQYKDLFNYSQELICMHDLNGRIEKANPALCAVMEMAEKDLVGKNLKHFLPEQDHPLFTDTYLPTIQTGNMAKGLFRFNTHSGRRIYLLFQNYKVVHENEDLPPYVIAFAQDVTGKIAAERQLKEAKKIIEETAKVKEKFLTNMSHEIRAPMTRILEMTTQLINNVPALRQQAALDAMQQSSEHILGIINDILDLEKVNTGNIVFENAGFDVARTIRTAMNSYREEAEAKNLKFIFDNRLPPAYEAIGDAGRLVQVMENLLSNAVKFTHEGSIIVFVAIEKESPVDVTLHISVKDTGIGIDEDKLIKIFQPFAQAHEGKNNQYGGTGLGLTLIKKLISLQNGTIWVESRPKKGSTFHFNIAYHRFSDPKTYKNEAKTINVTNRLGKLKVLLAEDNEVNQLLARSVLQYLGLESRIAKNGEEAVQLLLAEDFDVILMDVHMPVMGGVDATIEIRNLSDEKKRNIPIIALTASTLKGEEERYIASGMNGFIPKPFKEEDLYNAIVKVVPHAEGDNDKNDLA